MGILKSLFHITNKVDKWWTLGVFFKRLAFSYKIIEYNPKLHKVVKVSSKHSRLFYFNSLVFVYSQCTAIFLTTIQLLYINEESSSNAERVLRIILGAFFTIAWLLIMIFSYTYILRTIHVLQTHNSIFLYEAKVTSKCNLPPSDY
jgi:hypothetical protein